MKKIDTDKIDILSILAVCCFANDFIECVDEVICEMEQPMAPSGKMKRLPVDDE